MKFLCFNYKFAVLRLFVIYKKFLIFNVVDIYKKHNKIYNKEFNNKFNNVNTCINKCINNILNNIAINYNK